MFHHGILATLVRVLRLLIRLIRGRGGAALPGLIVTKLAPGYLPRMLKHLSPQLIVVTGSSGKSTTAKMVTTILAAHGHRVFLNQSTANIEQGLATALLLETSWRGEFPFDICVLEMDEAHAYALREVMSPRGVILTNVMADQINRFSDAGYVADMLATVGSLATSWIVTHGHDGLLRERLENARPQATVHIVSVSDGVRRADKHDLGLLVWREDNAEFSVEDCIGLHATLHTPSGEVAATLSAPGAHNAVNLAMALSATKADQGQSWNQGVALEAISAMPTVFARNERVFVKGQAMEFLLVQNTASLQLNLDQLGGQPGCFLFALGNDVTDFSYFWPATPTGLERVDMITGQKAHDAALYFGYLGVDTPVVNPDYASALEAFLALPMPESGIKTVMFTADAMRRTRAAWGLV